MIEKKTKENGEHFRILVCYFFNAKWNRSRCRSRWENLDHGQYRFQPIKSVNSVVSSPCETELYDKTEYWYVRSHCSIQRYVFLCVWNKSGRSYNCLKISHTRLEIITTYMYIISVNSQSCKFYQNENRKLAVCSHWIFSKVYYYHPTSRLMQILHFDWPRY